jgi:glycosyltransferase involved in cell wall biosynthesis
MTPLVSILIPAYNAEAWIADTIRSALGQTWPRKEIIVVDDGSTDGTLAVARRFASSDVSVVAQENQGAAAARNHAFSLCQGDHIQWLDADDLLAPDKVARQMEARAPGDGERTLLSCSWGSFMYRPHRAKFVPTRLWCDLSPAEWLRRKMGENLHMQTATWLVSRRLTEAAGPWDTRLLVDNDGEYFCRVLLVSDGVRFVPGAHVYYRISGSSRVSYIGRSEPKMKALFISMRLHIGYLRSLDDGEETRAACVRYLQNRLGEFCPERPDIVHQAEELAAELGGRLDTPRLSWKWDWIRRLCGLGPAKAVQMHLRQLKETTIRGYDRMIARLEGRRGAVAADVEPIGISEANRVQLNRGDAVRQPGTGRTRSVGRTSPDG